VLGLREQIDYCAAQNSIIKLLISGFGSTKTDFFQQGRGCNRNSAIERGFYGTNIKGYKSHLRELYLPFERGHNDAVARRGIASKI